MNTLARLVRNLAWTTVCRSVILTLSWWFLCGLDVWPPCFPLLGMPPPTRHTCCVWTLWRKNLRCTAGLHGRMPVHVQSGLALTNAILYEKEEIITGGSQLQLRVWGLKQLGKWLPLWRKPKPLCRAERAGYKAPRETGRSWKLDKSKWNESLIVSAFEMLLRVSAAHLPIWPDVRSWSSSPCLWGGGSNVPSQHAQHSAWHPVTLRRSAIILWSEGVWHLQVGWVSPGG